MRRRRVLYDATSRAAASAAELVRGEFEVSGLSVAANPTAEGPVVILAGRDGIDARWTESPLRVIALIDGDSDGPWPAHWHAVLPAAVSAAMLARAIDNAFADLDRARIDGVHGDAAAEGPARELEREVGDGELRAAVGFHEGVATLVLEIIEVERRDAVGVR